MINPLSAQQVNDPKSLEKHIEKQNELISNQQHLIEEQSRLLKEQAYKLESLIQRVSDLETVQSNQKTTTVIVESPDKGEKASNVRSDETQTSPMNSKQTTYFRDPINDLNIKAVTAGEFPGSIKIPGPRDVSLAIGGFIKTVAFHDTKSERDSVYFLPALLGNNDNDGETFINADLSRFNIDARAPSDIGQIRGYLEFDFNDSSDFNLRHAYASADTQIGNFIAGQYWTNFMDLSSLIEGLTDPTISGVIFVRQPQLRWSNDFGSGFGVRLSLEDASNNDTFSDIGGSNRSPYPDTIGAVSFNKPDVGHFNLGVLIRDIRLERGDGREDSGLGWGVSLSGHINTFGSDRFILGGTYGDGIGRYMLGLDPQSAGVLDADGNLDIRSNFGAYLMYQRYWNESFRSNFGYGVAYSDPENYQDGDTFDNSSFAMGNLIWQVLPFMSVGIEYNYGSRENKDGEDFDNHRFILGMQVF